MTKYGINLLGLTAVAFKVLLLSGAKICFEWSSKDVSMHVKEAIIRLNACREIAKTLRGQMEIFIKKQPLSEWSTTKKSMKTTDIVEVDNGRAFSSVGRRL